MKALIKREDEFGFNIGLFTGGFVASLLWIIIIVVSAAGRRWNW